MNREYHKCMSRHLRQEMELLVFGHAGARVVVFPTRSGRFYDYENWCMVEALRPKIEQGWLQLFCVDSVDSQSFYRADCHPSQRIHRHLEYERYLLDEVLPFTITLNSSPYLIVHGCSMGAYHAVNFAFRHPQLVRKVVALSGRYDLTQEIGDFRDLFDAYYDEDIYFNMPCHYMSNLRDETILAQLRAMEIILSVGDSDPFVANNQRLSDSLNSLHIPHTLSYWSGRAHKPKYWRAMVDRYL